ncbi:hypothetical protein BGZ60DRAFT_402539 [Tricladium varicosporioides]|nr:hypothetical protein BGZ60DRAFT_402539 [Hymenoscyphus varicosporioides]
MKLISTLSHVILFDLAFANPISSSSSLEARDVSCRLKSGIDRGNCRNGPSLEYSVIRYVYPNENIGVNCNKFWDPANGNWWWDWVPGWGCWVSRSIVVSGCDKGVPDCSWWGP